MYTIHHAPIFCGLLLSLTAALSGCDKQIDLSERPRHTVTANLGGTFVEIEVPSHLNPDGGGTDKVVFEEAGGRFAVGSHVKLSLLAGSARSFDDAIKHFEESGSERSELISKQETDDGFEFVTAGTNKKSLKLERVIAHGKGEIRCYAQHVLRGTDDTIAIEPSTKALQAICASVKIQS